MRSKYLLSTLRTAALALAATLTAGAALAQTTVHLVAAQESVDVAGASVPMWVFRCDPAFSEPQCTDGPISPTIEATSGTALTIFLLNQLSEPVSLVIPGQTPDSTSGAPVFAAGRVRSFAMETAASSSASYSWPALKAGAYLLRSGSEPAVQVQMGLYAGLVVDDPSTIADDDDVVLTFSEIDPVMHEQVVLVAAGGSCGDTARCSTLDYSPRYFLINGRAYDETTPPAPIDVTPGAVNRLRLLNAGQNERVAMLGDGLEMTLRLEDGFAIPIVKTQASALLAPGKAFDADVAIPALEIQAGEEADLTIGRTWAVYDRRLGLTNDNQPGGGALAYLRAAGDITPPAPTSPQIALDKSWVVNEGSNLTSDVLAGDTIVGALTEIFIASSTQHGTLVETATPREYTYTPAPGFTGRDSFAYYFEASGSYSNVAVVSLDVSNLNDLPVAAADSYTNTWVGTLTVDKSQGLLANDSDPDGDALLACVTDAVPWLSLAAGECFDGTFSYTGSSTSFTYSAWDGTLDGGGNKVLTAPVAVDITMNSTAAPSLVVQSPTTGVDEYRWVLEEDPTFHPEDGPDLGDYVVDGQIDWASVPMDEVLALSFHKSYAPVLAQGCVGSGCEEVRAFSEAALPPPTDPTKPRHYFVSVLPLDGGDGVNGHTLGGTAFASGASTVTVRVNDQPEPSAQISIVAFEDNHPTNGSFDPGNGERLLPGFQIILEDAGGRYGASAGLVLEDKDGLFLRNALCPGAGAGVVQPGVVLTCPEGHPRAGEALIQNLVPAKYGVMMAPPGGDTSAWVQTSTIEGKKVIDAWVKAGEPPYFQEFGPPGYHVFVGFVKPNATMPADVSGTNSVTGRVTNLHMSRPPDQTLWDSGSHDALAHSPAWVGVNLDGGVGFNYLAVEANPETGEFSLNGLPDGTHQLVVWDKFLDTVIGYRNLVLPCDPAPCDLGNVPVFNWFARTEQSVFEDLNGNGVRDEGEAGMLEQGTNIRWRDGTLYQSFPTDLFGDAPYDETFPFFHWLVAEVDFARYEATGLTVQVDSGGDASNDGVVGNASTTRTDTGPVLTQGFQAFLGQTNRFAWGKRAYGPGQNGGISGVVIYATTRAEDDPGLAAAEPWEPGIPRVTVRLYKKLADGDPPVLSLVGETLTDSWDDSLPDGCPGNTGTSAFEMALGDRCYDGIRNFNQARPAVFDGGFAFDGLEPGNYVVEVVPPPGYEILKEEDKNVDFGSAFQSAFVFTPDGTHLGVPDAADVRAAAAGSVGAPECVGADRVVPDYLSLFPGQMLDAPFAGYQRPLCTRQEVVLTDRSNAGAEFFLLTKAPIAGHLVGMILDDTAVEFNRDSPNFGEKWAPPEMPVSIRDWTGREISRVYSDQWGRYNALVPSTFTMNVPMSSGASPAMLTTCMNDALLPGGGLDPKHDPRYSTFCYTFQYMPGTTTYLDTPVLPLSAFAAGDNPVDCAFPNGTPRVASVAGDVPAPWVRHGSSLTIDSVGLVEVPNPAYSGPTGTEPRLVERDFRFGGQRGRVLLQGLGLPYEIPVASNNWKQGRIVTGAIPVGVLPGDYQLVVARADGRRTVTSVTVTVAAAGTALPSVVAPGESIQAAIDAATTPGELILVAPGTWMEPVILSKPVKLQGSGEATVLNARPFDNFDTWYQKLETLYAGGAGWTPAPGQAVVFGGLEPDALLTESVPVVTVVALEGAFTGQGARVDGFTLTGAEVGGGVFVNGWADDLQISNNRITNNGGFYGGGIRVGHFTLDQATPLNSDVSIHHNAITQNGASGGVGGGVSLCSGSDGYLVADNWICGNFTQGDGAGIGHHGRSDGGRIARNQVVFNQSFSQGLTRHGGGIMVNGIDAATGGTGEVTIDANQIQGNHAAAGDGAGIRVQLTADPVEITNNMVVNNVAGGAGGGISVLASGDVTVVNNTIAHNDSTATVGGQFTAGTPNSSEAVPAGVVADAVSAPGLDLINNIVWENRSFRYMVLDGSAQLCPGDTADGATSCGTGDFFDDLGGNLTPLYNVLTDPTGYDPSNTSGDPGFVESYFNQARSVVRGTPEATTLPIDVAPALDEGGNFIEVRYGPITLTRNPSRLWGDYHIDPPMGGGGNAPANPALDNGDAAAAPVTDFDAEVRPIGDGVDRGADEVSQQ